MPSRTARSHGFSEALDEVLEDLKAGRPFALVRYNDGEYKAVRGERYTAVDGWRSPSGSWWLKDALAEALTYSAPGYWVGITPSCCGIRAARWYAKQASGRQTFGTIFNNANYRRAQAELTKVDAFWVASDSRADLVIPKDCVTDAWDYGRIIESILKATKPVFISAGPLANVLIHRVWQRRRDVSLVDVGSIFDTEVLRTYQDPSAGLQNHVCSWVYGSKVAAGATAPATTVVIGGSTAVAPGVTKVSTSSGVRVAPNTKPSG